MNLTARDQNHIWHPYTQHKTALLPIGIKKGESALLWDENGKEYIDAIASWWVNPYGHSNRYVADAIYKQLTTLEHVLFGGFTHEPAIELSERLMQILPSNQQKIFFSDNGSTAVEVAIKASFQYFHNQDIKKTKIIAFENAFHGDTFGAMAASGISFFTDVFKDSLLEVVRIPVPVLGAETVSLQAMEIALQSDTIAAFIFEPLVQGAAGMVMYDASVLDQLIQLCKAKNVLTIADEVMTGFGKTGKIFACDYLQQQPDMMCLSKALTAGVVPMSVTTFTQDIFEAFYDDDVNKALFHGHSFMANPVGCAAALAGLDLLHSEEIKTSLVRIHQKHQIFQTKIKNHPKVKATRLMGVIFALDIKTDGEQAYYGSLRNKLYQFFIENGIILRPVGGTIYILPPYVISDAQLDRIYDVIEQAFALI